MNNNNTSFPANLPILDGKNWDQWCVKMNVIFSFQEVEELITTRYEPLAANATAEQQTAFREVKKKDNKALFLITNVWIHRILKRLLEQRLQRKLRIFSVMLMVEEIKLRRSKGKKKQDNEARHSRQHDSDSDGFLLMVTTNSESDNSKLWYLDTGCSNHMTGHRDWLLEFDENFKSKVKFADDSAISVEGKGKVMVRRKNGNNTFVTDVLYVPTMKHNLLSLGQLLEKGFNYSTKVNAPRSTLPDCCANKWYHEPLVSRKGPTYLYRKVPHMIMGKCPTCE
ncbi:hypothetical protein L195_g037750 [Trifolium pratense]|uniref:Retrovirus-related Pol polyprotein from transposon TNT 1-94-like beta-barrel domain-containing protein n=1 Tax=Trifolium pratense TaxID=57577 RepID=A0A2K3LT52_TRIPR|nr:hypothetical protein L195_g037750 [Trifolium pratense]